MGERVKHGSATANTLLLVAFFLTHMLHSAEGIRPLTEDSGFVPADDDVDGRLYRGTTGLRLSLVEASKSGPSPGGGGGHRLEGLRPQLQNPDDSSTPPSAPAGGKP